MLHVFYGTNTHAVRESAHRTAQHIPDMKLVRIDADTFVPGVLVDALGSVSLFGEKTAYVIDTPSQDEAFNEEVTGLLSAMGESENLFVLIEAKLLAPQKKILGKYAASIEETTKDKETPFNVFALADSLSQKNKKSLWLGLCAAKDAGLSSEEIIGTLWWQLKTLRLAALTHNAQEAGMNDYPYSKAKRSLSNFKAGELQQLSEGLLAVYHEGHQGEVAIDLALEKWTLTI